MTTTTIPAAALSQHVAIVGKTGSGKTSTAKLAIEQVAAEGSRVCVLDPIKSDWWGVISSADGKRPGLPFHVLGGPHAHVPLHSGAGAAIAELVARGDLTHSVLDMADFEPGGQQRFFVAFAETLLKRMRGVLYLVLEEAHEFAPKERAGFEKENLAIHYAKKLATAGRSKGIRLIVATQRTQALHNALLGSCDTLIAHRLTAPADQLPVRKWLDAQMDKATAKAIGDELASLKTGVGWLCSGESQHIRKITFPRISTFDNSATPTDDADELEVRGGDVDLEALRSLIGDAVVEAEANDPKKLKERIRQLEKAQTTQPTVALERVDEMVRRAEERVREELRGHAEERAAAAVAELRASVRPNVEALYHALANGTSTPIGEPKASIPEPKPAARAPIAPIRAPKPPPRATPAPTAPRRHVEGISKPQQRILDTIATLEPLGLDQVDKSIVAVFSGASPTSSSYANNLGALRTRGLIDYPSGGLVALTDDGRDVASVTEDIGSTDELHQAWLRHLTGPQQRILEALIEKYPDSIEKEELAEIAGASPTSSSFANNLGRMRTLGIIDYPGRGHVAATELLFPAGLR